MVEQGEGIKRIESKYSVDETVRRVRVLLESKGLKVFDIVDHSGEAAKFGLAMRPTKLLIFGSPKAGTPLMQAAPSTAIDLPLKALVAEDESGKVAIMWNDPAYLRARHGFPGQLFANLAPAVGLLQEAAE
jgi:uncharacterized protein (DUF302 family)